MDLDAVASNTASSRQKETSAIADGVVRVRFCQQLDKNIYLGLHFHMQKCTYLSFIFLLIRIYDFIPNIYDFIPNLICTVIADSAYSK